MKTAMSPINILSNRCDNGYLMPEYRMVDYFLFLKGETDSGFKEEIIRKLKTGGDCLYSFPVG